MAFACVHCGTEIEDETLKVPRSGAVCPSCKQDPTEGWSPYQDDIAAAGRKIADELNLRLMIHDFGVQEAALYFLEDLMLEKRHELSIRLGRKAGAEQHCSVCNADIPPDEGFRIEIYDKWRSTHIVLALCERHLSDGLWGRELDIHANHPNPWLTRGDWHYPLTRGEGQSAEVPSDDASQPDERQP